MQRAILLAAILGLALPTIGADLQPGKYRVTSKMEGDDPSAKPEEQCITQKDIDSGLSELGVQKDNKSCKVSDFKRGAGTVSYRTTCNQGAGSYATDVTGKFAAESFDMQMNVRMEKQPPMKLLVSGKRIGACSK